MILWRCVLPASARPAPQVTRLTVPKPTILDHKQAKVIGDIGTGTIGLPKRLLCMVNGVLKSKHQRLVMCPIRAVQEVDHLPSVMILP